MEFNKIFIVFVIATLFISGISSNHFAEASAINVETQCREGHVLVYRVNADKYACVFETTSQKWQNLGIAEQIEQQISDNNETSPTISAEFPFESHYVEVLGSKMHYIDEGEGDPILFIHGNPTSSYLWRNIIPFVTNDARVIAVDLIGMGKSDKPDIDYRFVDHAKYLDAFIEELELENITLVIHDWGSGLGFNYAMQNEDNIKGIAFMEAILMPMTSDEFPAEFREIFQMFRTPGIGEDMIMTQNFFVEQMLPGGILRELTEEEMNQYREPYPTVESRKPVWMWPNEIPMDGEPADVHKIVTDYNQWLQETEIPKILFYVNPGTIITAPIVEWSETNLKNLETVYVGEGIHFIQEDHPDEIGKGLAEWYRVIKFSDKMDVSDRVVDVTHVIDANNQFAINFYSQVSKENDENIFFSPWSISTAFAIAYEGAKEKTAQEIQQTFGYPSDYDTRTSEFKTVIDDLNPDGVTYQLSVANALWLAERFEPLQEYVETATTYYDSEVSTVDFISDDGVDKINAWVEEKTNEKIKDILAPDSTDELTRLVITNAIYFKGNWVTQFNENATRDDPFWITPNDKVAVPMMRLEPKIFNYTQSETMQILKMPYEGDRLSMLVLLPNEKDGLPELEESLSFENLKQWNEQLIPNEIRVFMPKFKLETEYDLRDPLHDMGIKAAFDPFDADFRGIAGDLYIAFAIHKAFVDVNEEGTEAAAATAIGVGTTSVKPPVPVFKADHPYVFLIQDDSSGNVLFIGRVVDPTK